MSVKNYLNAGILPFTMHKIGLNENGECVVEIPYDLLLKAAKTPLLSLVNFVYPNLLTDMMSSRYFEDEAIFCRTTESVE